jgi:serine/threonine protein kinase
MSNPPLLSITCPSCDESLVAHARFCHGCGASLNVSTSFSKELISSDFSESGTDTSDAAPKTTIDKNQQEQLIFANRWCLEHVIGRGGMGIVYRGKDLQKGTPVAVKILPAGISKDTNTVKRFLKEANLLQGLEHENLIDILDSGFEHAHYFFIMEYVDGSNLEEYCRKQLLPLAEGLELATQILTALAYIHQKNLVHRDLKPANIMLNQTHQIKLLDFGLAKNLIATSNETVLTKTDVILGTTPFMAPEQILNPGQVDLRTDIYSFGVLLYWIVSGEHPFRGADDHEMLNAHISKQPVPPSMYLPEIGIEADKVILKCLAKNPDDRFQSADEVIQSLQKVEGAQKEFSNNYTRTRVASPILEPIPGVTSGSVTEEGFATTSSHYSVNDETNFLETNAEEHTSGNRVMVLGIILVFSVIGGWFIGSLSKETPKPQHVENPKEVEATQNSKLEPMLIPLVKHKKQGETLKPVSEPRKSKKSSLIPKSKKNNQEAVPNVDFSFGKLKKGEVESNQAGVLNDENTAFK